jgi:PDZ domain-containing secreted protein
MKLQEKAWTIDNSNFEEPWFAPNNVFYAESEGKAKIKAFREVYDCGCKDSRGNDFTFLTVKIKRAKQADKYLVDGSVKTLKEIEYDQQVREYKEHIDKLVRENEGGYAYIKKGGYYYRDNHCGYTEFVAYAGVYSILEAATTAKSCSLRDGMKIIPINPEEHNKMIQEKIEDLTSRLILNNQGV